MYNPGVAGANQNLASGKFFQPTPLLNGIKEPETFMDWVTSRKKPIGSSPMVNQFAPENPLNEVIKTPAEIDEVTAPGDNRSTLVSPMRSQADKWRFGSVDLSKLLNSKIEV